MFSFLLLKSQRVSEAAEGQQEARGSMVQHRSRRRKTQINKEAENVLPLLTGATSCS